MKLPYDVMSHLNAPFLEGRQQVPQQWVCGAVLSGEWFAPLHEEFKHVFRLQTKNWPDLMAPSM